MTKKLVFMRTHILEWYVIIEFNKLRYSMNRGDECILFVDNTKNIVAADDDDPIKVVNFNGIDIKCFLFNHRIHEESGLPYFTGDIYNNDSGEILWYNGDYPFYYIKKYFPNYDYYWCTEYDVFCNGNSYKPFFKRYEKEKSDFISADLRHVDMDNPRWTWSDKTEWMYKRDENYGSFFPVVRLSANALNFLYNRRIEHGEIFEKIKENPEYRWIFCEAFVPSELMKHNYSCKWLNTECLRYSPDYNLNKERIFEFPDFKLYHPVR